MYTAHCTCIINSLTPHISRLDSAHHWSIILTVSTRYTLASYVCYIQAKRLIAYCVSFTPRDDDVRESSVLFPGPSRSTRRLKLERRLASLSMFLRSRKKTKALASAHTEHDAQSETDTQSQASDATSSAEGAYSQAARVRIGEALPRLTVFLTTLCIRMGADSSQRRDSGFRLESYVGTRALLGRSISSNLFPQWGSPWVLYSWSRPLYLTYQVISQSF